MPAAPEFVAACWTSAGDVMPLRGPDTSPLDVRTRIEAVARAGYTGFGLTHADLLVARETVGLPTVAQLLRDHGLTTVQLERVVDWWTTGERKERSDALRQDLFDACAVLGVDNIKVGGGRRRGAGDATTRCASASTRSPTRAVRPGCGSRTRTRRSRRRRSARPSRRSTS